MYIVETWLSVMNLSVNEFDVQMFLQLFVYLFAPLCQQLRPTDFNNFRLENGFRIWPSMWSHKSPDPVCFVCPVKPKQALDPYFVRKTKKDPFGDVFTGNNRKLLRYYIQNYVSIQFVQIRSCFQESSTI